MGSKQAMKQALEALEAVSTKGDVACVVTPEGDIWLSPAITALREALAEQPAQQEPVFSFQMQLKPGWGSQYPSPCVIGDPDLNSLFGKIGDVVTFYTSTPAQRTWVGLTDDEVDNIISLNYPAYFDVARAIEAKLKEKNNG